MPPSTPTSRDSHHTRDTTSLQGASRASLFPPQDSDEEQQTTAISGLRCFESSVWHNRPGSSVRMLVVSLLGTTGWYSNRCTLTWKAKVTKSRRSLFQLVPYPRHTAGIGSGLLPTMQTQGLKVCKRGKTVFLKLDGLLPTPSAREKGGVGNSKPRDNVESVVELGATKGQIGRRTGLRLQPAFVEWMMGYPEGWTEIPDLKLLEMRSSRKSPR